MPSPSAADREPEIRDLSKLREHQKRNMQKWFRRGTFWLTLRSKLDKAPVLLIGKENAAIKEEYQRIAESRRTHEVFAGTFKSDKAKKQLQLLCSGSSPELATLGDLLFSLADKSVASFTWNGAELLPSTRPPSPAQLAALVAELSQRDRSVEEQIDLDVQAWQGVLRHPGDAACQRLVSRLFTLLVHGGLLYREQNQGTWKTWARGMAGFPVASVLSHGGRVLVQLPPGDEATQIFEWLVPQKFRRLTRPFASHGLSTLQPAVTILRREKHLKEDKGLSTAAKELTKRSKHLGINLPLFGHGKVHPHSRRLVSANGEHGHLYIYYRPGQDNIPGGLLIGCEGSEAGKSDQYGHKHDARALSAPISPTSGMKWRLLGQGPGCRGEANDTLFLDLSQNHKALMKLSAVKQAATAVL